MKYPMKKYRRGSFYKPISDEEYDLEELLKEVYEGRATIKAQYDLENRLKINIVKRVKKWDGYSWFTTEDDFYYYCLVDMDVETFNKTFGCGYITNWNLYL